VLWYRSADGEISGRASFKISPCQLECCLEERHGGALRAGIRGLPEALMGTEV